MNAQIVHDHDTAFRQRRDQALLDIGREDLAIDRLVEYIKQSETLQIPQRTISVALLNF
jgi:phosphate uptake regulator